MKLAGLRYNLEKVYGSFISNQLFIKNISQLREEKCYPAAIIYFLVEKFFVRCLSVPLTAYAYEEGGNIQLETEKLIEDKLRYFRVPFNLTNVQKSYKNGYSTRCSK